MYGLLVSPSLFQQRASKMKSKAEGDGVLVTEEQQAWIKTQHMTHRLRPLKRVTLPGDAVGDWCYRLSHHKWFDASVMICILINTFVMAMQFFGQGDVYTRFEHESGPLEC